ncbi:MULTISPECIES: DUF2970 domain-containing protein [Hydrogenophaga]|uniref:Membrane protein n=1 Tax=Hydrogenophaga electricum TaxID=1230953 RepID=A0ABQ6C519_9BURK|nr:MULTISPECIES: DUF2970 domain-containing protein [Hydrogenophaga]GLS14708.1 membrane protein [Hydrogenophaga electricum]
MSTQQPTPPARKGSLKDTVKAVLWGFLGVRRQADYQKDIARLNPLHIMAVGVVLAFLFVLLLMGIVNWVAGG